MGSMGDRGDLGMMLDRPAPATLRQYHRHNRVEGKRVVCDCAWCDAFRRSFGKRYDPASEPELPRQREVVDTPSEVHAR